MSKDFLKLPRLYINQPLGVGGEVVLESGPAHYFRTVLRRQEGDQVRIFNGKDGEFTATILRIGKKDGQLGQLTLFKAQPAPATRAHLFFAPIKKQRMDILIEKAVELGATDFHPILTARTEIRKLNAERIKTQIIEASEQCERMDMPILHEIQQLNNLWSTPLNIKPLFWCQERAQTKHISTLSSENWAFLIGPEGGFDENEIHRLSNAADITPISLGTAIYRAETAAMVCLAHVASKQNI